MDDVIKEYGRYPKDYYRVSAKSGKSGKSRGILIEPQKVRGKSKKLRKVRERSGKLKKKSGNFFRHRANIFRKIRGQTLSVIFFE